MNCKQNLLLTQWAMAIFIAILILAGSVLAVGQTESVIYRFQGGSDGIDPEGGLISDKAGNFYGTNFFGGPDNEGTVFQLSPPAGKGGSWTETVLYSFTGGSDGARPRGDLIFDQAGNLYGVAEFEGPNGAGTVFELKPQGGSWTETTLYSFPQNLNPNGGLAFDKAGNLYGTIYNGGAHGFGSVFQLTPTQGGWTETTIHDFGGGSDGAYPFSAPIVGQGGNLLGTTSEGGNGTGGVIYELKPPATKGGAWTERLLYRFCAQSNCSDGSHAHGRLVFDAKGNLYGATYGGGASGDGTVFQLTRQGSSWTEAVLYSFCSLAKCADGAFPTGSVIFDGKGHLYGGGLGGKKGHCGERLGCGTVFRLTPPATQSGVWTETVLHNFPGNQSDGYEPIDGLILGKFGSVWGTTRDGGSYAGTCGTAFFGCGTVFRIFP